MANFSFRLYHEGYESPKKEFEIDDTELEGMTEEEKEEYVLNEIVTYVRESLEITELEEC